MRALGVLRAGARRVAAARARQSSTAASAPTKPASVESEAAVDASASPSPSSSSAAAAADAAAVPNPTPLVAAMAGIGTPFALSGGGAAAAGATGKRSYTFEIVAGSILSVITTLSVLFNYDPTSRYGGSKEGRIVTLSDGRRVSVAEYGDENGAPVFYVPSRGQSRLEPRALALTDRLAARGVRLIALDRPEYAFSEVADKLGVDKFSVVAFGGGAPYALACASKCSEVPIDSGDDDEAAPKKTSARGRLVHVAVVSGEGPMLEDGFPWHDSPYVRRYLMKAFSFFHRCYRQYDRIRMFHDPVGYESRMLRSMPADDAGVVRALPYGGVSLMLSRLEAFKRGVRGYCTDLKLQWTRTWGFKLESVRFVEASREAVADFDREHPELAAAPPPAPVPAAEAAKASIGAADDEDSLPDGAPLDQLELFRFGGAARSQSAQAVARPTRPVQSRMLVYHGRRDAVFRSSHAAYVAKHVPGAELVEFDDGHYGTLVHHWDEIVASVAAGVPRSDATKRHKHVDPITGIDQYVELT